MKTSKRILTLILAVVFMITLVLPVYAAENDGKITVTNPIENETYTLYKIFDVPYYTENASSELDKVAYTYPKTGNASFISALQAEASPFNVELNGDVYSVSLKDGKTASDIETFIKANISYFTAVATATADADATPVVFNNLPYGYYFVTTTVGSFATIDTAVKEIEIQEKNAMPTVVKKVKEDSTQAWGDEATYSINDDIPYKATVTLGKGNDKDITLTDTLENQIFNEDSIAIDGWTKDTDYTVSFNTDKTVMTVVLKAAKIKTLDALSEIAITYSAKFDESKTDLTKAAGNDNTIKLEYSHETITDSTKVKTYQFDLVKTDGDRELLVGAKFSLWDAATDGNKIDLIYDETLNAYRPIVDGETATGIVMTETAQVTLYGLDTDKYYLQEDIAPAGFNKLTTRSEVNLTANNAATVEDGKWIAGGIHIENNAGVVLPSTGGTGTVIFVTVGAIIALAAGIFIITNKRMSKDYI